MQGYKLDEYLHVLFIGLLNLPSVYISVFLQTLASNTHLQMTEAYSELQGGGFDCSLEKMEVLCAKKRLQSLAIEVSQDLKRYRRTSIPINVAKWKETYLHHPRQWTAIIQPYLNLVELHFSCEMYRSHESHLQSCTCIICGIEMQPILLVSDLYICVQTYIRSFYHQFNLLQHRSKITTIRFYKRQEAHCLSLHVYTLQETA